MSNSSESIIDRAFNSVVDRPLQSLADRFDKDFKEALAEDAKRHEVISYWCKHFENANYSPKEFYSSVFTR